MKVENHISDILQLYEFSMSIGKSLDYNESCDLLLKLLLKRKNLNAAWILERDAKTIVTTYSIPLGRAVKVVSNQDIEERFASIKDFKLFDHNAFTENLYPIDIETGHIAVFNLDDQGFLFLCSKKETIKHKDLVQLKPVIHKFSTSLKACKAFKKQQLLLNDLEAQNQELSDYAHMVSHDLKSPLRSIDTLTSWLQDDYKNTFDEHGKKQLGLIRNSVGKMDTLINGILEYSTIGKNRIESYEVDLNLLIDDILKIIQVPDHISITRDNLPVINGDKYRLQQLFQNLISNAIKYNDKKQGLIEINVKNQNDFWEFYIKDNGIGIEDVYYDKIFETFQKLENNPESTGIGLAIVKKIVTLYEGNIWLESEINKGTTFYFTIKK